MCSRGENSNNKHTELCIRVLILASLFIVFLTYQKDLPCSPCLKANRKPHWNPLSGLAFVLSRELVFWCGSAVGVLTQLCILWSAGQVNLVLLFFFFFLTTNTLCMNAYSLYWTWYKVSRSNFKNYHRRNVLLVNAPFK